MCFILCIHFEKWNISCHISKQGCHQLSAIPVPQYELVSPKRTQEGEYLLSNSHQGSTTPCEKHRILTQGSCDTEERNDFRESRLLHLPIHRKVLNSLTWDIRTSLVTQTVNNLPAMRETWVQSLGRDDPLEKGMAAHSSILAWRSPWTEELGRLQSMGSQAPWTGISGFL